MFGIFLAPIPFRQRGSHGEKNGLSRIARAVLSPLLVLVIAAGCGKSGHSGAAHQPPPSVVVVETAERRTVPIVAEMVARTEAISTIEVRANVEGRLEEKFFEEGRMVRKGQKLFHIDARRYQAAVQSAQAAVEKAAADLELAREQQKLINAQSALRQAEANLLKSNQDLERLKPLAARRAVPARDLDAAVAAQASAQASVEDARATVRTTTVSDRMGLRQAEASLNAAKAELVRARLDLEETGIISPIDGVIGRVAVDVGNYVGRGSATLLATISQLDPIRLVFNVPETLYLHFAKKGANRTGLDDIELILSDNSKYPHRGRYAFMGGVIEAKTGTLTIEARFPNPNGQLLPGMFGRARVAAETRPNAVLVSERSVFDVQGSKAVYVVAADNTVSLRSVTTEGSYEGKSVITSGLNGGEKVVVEGILKLRPGAPVTPQPSSQQPAKGGNR